MSRTIAGKLAKEILRFIQINHKFNTCGSFSVISYFFIYNIEYKGILDSRFVAILLTFEQHEILDPVLIYILVILCANTH